MGGTLELGHPRKIASRRQDSPRMRQMTTKNRQVRYPGIGFRVSADSIEDQVTCFVALAQVLIPKAVTRRGFGGAEKCVSKKRRITQRGKHEERHRCNSRTHYTAEREFLKGKCTEWERRRVERGKMGGEWERSCRPAATLLHHAVVCLCWVCGTNARNRRKARANGTPEEKSPGRRKFSRASGCLHLISGEQKGGAACAAPPDHPRCKAAYAALTSTRIFFTGSSFGRVSSRMPLRRMAFTCSALISTGRVMVR